MILCDLPYAVTQNHWDNIVPMNDYIEMFIKTYTNEGMTVLDNCIGSGSTGVACLNTGRKFIGIEKEEKYFNIAKERLEESEKNNGIELA